MVRQLVVFVLWMLILVPAGMAQNPAASVEEITNLLHAKDQALMDAVTTGDPKVWDAMLAPDVIYLDESGELSSRADLLSQIKPLAAGVSGNIKVTDYKLILHGDTATVFMADEEEENFHGAQLHARYLVTETWQKTGTEWKLLLAHVYATLFEPPMLKVNPQDLDAYIGRYAAGDLIYVISRDGDHLLGGREGKPGSVLKGELKDMFFIAGQLRTRKIFQRDANGKVIGFLDRREGVDLPWKRIN
ncbi:MAG TPA: nuclear transport factor 2 family protein [Terriglobales bacterium]|nr:nuclear transport factor 2 family protein [Terriglobales bacterium]